MAGGLPLSSGFGLLSTSSFQFGNNLGIGIGMEGITGVNERIWPVIFTPLGIILIFWAKNLYKVLENLMKILVMIMIVAFFINLVLTRPEISQLARGFVPSRISPDSLNILAAMMATSFALAAALYQSYLAQDKGWKPENLKKQSQGYLCRDPDAGPDHCHLAHHLCSSFAFQGYSCLTRRPIWHFRWKPCSGVQPR